MLYYLKMPSVCTPNSNPRALTCTHTWSCFAKKRIEMAGKQQTLRPCHVTLCHTGNSTSRASHVFCFCFFYLIADSDENRVTICDSSSRRPLSYTDMPECSTCGHRYWSAIDEAVREAAVLRGIRVRLLISFWEETHPLTVNFVTSLQSLCMQLLNCSIEAVRAHPPARRFNSFLSRLKMFVESVQA